jgi:glycosyltransferase involved in cell wall biosynthesis
MERIIKHTHSFLIPAFGHSPFLEECLHSLVNQTVRTNLIISTSTPFDGLYGLAEKFGALVYVHSPNLGIAHDWNMGLSKINTDWVTVAHQDDIYLPTFTEKVLSVVRNKPDVELIFTDYAELLDGGVRTGTVLLIIKKLLLELGFCGRNEIKTTLSKMNCLRFGCPIPCPSVTFRGGKRDNLFNTRYRVNMDWAAWLEKAIRPGSFVWIKEILMQHRIHRASETSEGIAQGYRATEDLELLSRIWPRPIARLIAGTYSVAYSSNEGS